MTGSAIAIPLMGASGASAADGTTWDKVAECESGGSWSADAGNGYYGGLQLTQDDWEEYGGLDYAPSADQASRSQQIAVAEKILADRGPGAWPTCGLLSGLSKKSGAANVDTGVGSGSSGSSGSSKSSGTSTPSLSTGLGLSGSPQASGDSSAPSHSPTAEPDAAGAPSATPTKPPSSTPSPDKGSNPAKPDTSPEVDASGSSVPDASPSITPEWGNSDNYRYVEGASALVDTSALGTGRHRGSSAAEDSADGRTAAPSGRHASRGGDARAGVSGSYTVRSGDSLDSIADSLGLQGGWGALYDANKRTIGADPDRVVAGQTLDIPVETAQE